MPAYDCASRLTSSLPRISLTAWTIHTIFIRSFWLRNERHAQCAGNAHAQASSSTHLAPPDTGLSNQQQTLLLSLWLLG
jgi:hypothetical protein